MMWNNAALVFASLSQCVQNYSAHSSAVITCVFLCSMMWYTAALVLASLLQSVNATLHTVMQSLSVLFYGR